jgi:hypothetical protein
LRVPGNIEGIAYRLVALGIALDHLSTRIGLLNPMIREFNQFTVHLAQNNLWLPFDAFMLSVAIAIPALFIRRTSLDGRRVMLLFPLLFGAARLGAATHNFALIFFWA